MCGGSSMLCLSIVLLDTLISPVVIPLSLRLLVGSVAEMDTASMMQDMLIMVAIPALIAMILFDTTRGKVAVTLKPKLSFFSKLILLTTIVANSTGCVPFLKNIDRTLVQIIVLIITMCIIGFLLGYWVPKLLHLPYPDCAAITLNSGLRNISAGAVLAIEYFPPEVLFPVAFSPVFLQLLTSVIVRIVMTTPFGKAYFANRSAPQA
jgi:predicted Na+-dependent transporter